MLKYDYKCTGCGHVFENTSASVEEWPCDETPNCKGTFRRVYSIGGIILKGSGFYRTDNRNNS